MSTGVQHERERSLVIDLSQLLGVHGSATYRQFLRVLAPPNPDRPAHDAGG